MSLSVFLTVAGRFRFRFVPVVRREVQQNSGSRRERTGLWEMVREQQAALERIWALVAADVRRRELTGSIKVRLPTSDALLHGWGRGGRASR